MARKIIIARDVEEQSRRAAEVIAEGAREAVAERGRFTLALSGGSSVRKAYEHLAKAEGIDWMKVFLFFGDERFVEGDNPYSTYKLVEESLLIRIPALPRTNVFPVSVDALTPEEGARRYADTIREFFQVGDGEWPRFDLTLNGMGPDGHTASLFPGREAVGETRQIAVMSHAGLSPWVDRVTLTLPVFNHARRVLFLANGAAKAEVLKGVLEGEWDVNRLPAQGVQPLNGEMIWLLEPGVASKLSDSLLRESGGAG